jgi:fumarate reductase subunit D
LRWARTVRDARPWGYAGLIFTHGLGWALLNVLASGLSPLSLWLLGLSFFLRLTLAMTVGAEVLGDRQVLPNLWLLPLISYQMFCACHRFSSKGSSTRMRASASARSSISSDPEDICSSTMARFMRWSAM